MHACVHAAAAHGVHKQCHSITVVIICVQLQINLLESTSSTLPVENAKHVRHALLPAVTLAIAESM